MLRRCPPEDILATIMVCDQWMLQAETVCNRANACPLESALCEFSNGRVQDRGSCLERALLFGPLARALLPDSFLRHLAFDYHGSQPNARLALQEPKRQPRNRLPRAIDVDGGDPRRVPASK